MTTATRWPASNGAVDALAAAGASPDRPGSAGCAARRQKRLVGESASIRLVATIYLDRPAPTRVWRPTTTAGECGVLVEHRDELNFGVGSASSICPAGARRRIPAPSARCSPTFFNRLPTCPSRRHGRRVGQPVYLDPRRPWSGRAVRAADRSERAPDPARDPHPGEQFFGDDATPGRRRSWRCWPKGQRTMHNGRRRPRHAGGNEWSAIAVVDCGALRQPAMTSSPVRPRTSITPTPRRRRRTATSRIERSRQFLHGSPGQFRARDAADDHHRDTPSLRTADRLDSRRPRRAGDRGRPVGHLRAGRVAAGRKRRQRKRRRSGARTSPWLGRPVLTRLANHIGGVAASSATWPSSRRLVGSSRR